MKKVVGFLAFSGLVLIKVISSDGVDKSSNIQERDLYWGDVSSEFFFQIRKNFEEYSCVRGYNRSRYTGKGDLSYSSAIPY